MRADPLVWSETVCLSALLPGPVDAFWSRPQIKRISRRSPGKPSCV